MTAIIWDRRYHCPIWGCKKIFKTEFRYRQHMKTHFAELKKGGQNNDKYLKND